MDGQPDAGIDPEVLEGFRKAVKMTPAKCLEILAEHQLWRRARGKYAEPGAKSPHDELVVGIALDTAIDLLRREVQNKKGNRGKRRRGKDKS